MNEIQEIQELLKVLNEKSGKSFSLCVYKDVMLIKDQESREVLIVHYTSLNELITWLKSYIDRNYPDKIDQALDFIDATLECMTEEWCGAVKITLTEKISTIREEVAKLRKECTCKN